MSTVIFEVLSTGVRRGERLEDLNRARVVALAGDPNLLREAPTPLTQIEDAVRRAAIHESCIESRADDEAGRYHAMAATRLPGGSSFTPLEASQASGQIGIGRR